MDRLRLSRVSSNSRLGVFSLNMRMIKPYSRKTAETDSDIVCCRMLDCLGDIVTEDCQGEYSLTSVPKEPNRRVPTPTATAPVPKSITAEFRARGNVPALRG